MKRFPQVAVAQLGARLHYALPVILHRAGRLAHFYTDAYVGRGSAWQILGRMAPLLRQPWAPPRLRRLLTRREDAIPPDKVTAFNGLGLRYALAQRRQVQLGELERIYLDYGREFCRLVLKHNFPGADAVYAFQSAALPLFGAARDRGLRNFLECYSAPQVLQQQIYAEEARLWPDWDEPYPELPVWQARIDLEQQECRAADTIICPSDFVAQGLQAQGVPGQKISMVPYGVDTARFATTRPTWRGERPLQVLFIGGITIRKGVQYLDQALRRLNSQQYRARLVGPVLISDRALKSLQGRFDLTGRVPRSQVSQHYAWGDVFVFPSPCEGSATVTYEALAAGLPVITTDQAGSVVREGLDGFIVPVGDAQALADRLDRLVREPELLRWMSRNARRRAQEFSWERYGERLVAALDGNSFETRDRGQDKVIIP